MRILKTLNVCIVSSKIEFDPLDKVAEKTPPAYP